VVAAVTLQLIVVVVVTLAVQMAIVRAILFVNQIPLVPMLVALMVVGVVLLDGKLLTVQRVRRVILAAQVVHKQIVRVFTTSEAVIASDVLLIE
jgi:hypothetical protein